MIYISQGFNLSMSKIQTLLSGLRKPTNKRLVEIRQTKTGNYYINSTSKNDELTRDIGRELKAHGLNVNIVDVKEGVRCFINATPKDYFLQVLEALKIGVVKV